MYGLAFLLVCGFQVAADISHVGKLRMWEHWMFEEENSKERISWKEKKIEKEKSLKT